MTLNGEKNLIRVKINKQILIETLILIVISLLFYSNTLVQLIPVVYFFVERRIRKRTWSEIGFKFRNTFSDIKANWYWIAIIVMGIQILIIIEGKFLFPDYVTHIKERVPMVISISTLPSIIITLTIGTFLEEIIYRSLFQERLSWFIKPKFAIVLTSIIFALVHFSKGSLLIVSFDMLGIFIDSLIYGIIYNKTKNIFASWITHYLADIVGTALLLTFF